MAKVQYPPQGGEKHLCFTLFCTMMMSVVSAVAIIYAIVIIYLPAKVVLESTLQGPKMCTTLSKEGNLSGIETCQDWSSCEEWCLSIVSKSNQNKCVFKYNASQNHCLPKQSMFYSTFFSFLNLDFFPNDCPQQDINCKQCYLIIRKPVFTIACFTIFLDVHVYFQTISCHTEW